MKDKQKRILDLEEMGARLKKLREDAKMSQEKLAELLDCKRSTIINYEKGYTILPVARLDQYVQKFGVSADFILYGVDEEQTESITEQIQRMDNCGKKLEKLIDNLSHNVSYNGTNV